MQGFQSSQIYQQRGRLDQVLGEIELIRRSDADMEARIGTLGRWGCALWTAFVIALVATFVLWPLVVVTVPLLVVAIVLQVKKSKLAPFDVEDRRYELAARVLGMLGADLDPQAPVSIWLDLRPSNHASKLRGQGKAGRWDVRYFQNDWLWLSGALADGATFDLTMRERRQDRSCWKRNYRGKMKHKSKSKSKEVLTLALSVSARKHPALERVAQQAGPAVQLPPFARGLALQAKAGVLRLKAGMDGAWDEPALGAQPSTLPRASAAVAMMFLSLHNVVELARKASKRQAA